MKNKINIVLLLVSWMLSFPCFGKPQSLGVYKFDKEGKKKYYETELVKIQLLADNQVLIQGEKEECLVDLYKLTKEKEKNKWTDLQYLTRKHKVSPEEVKNLLPKYYVNEEDILRYSQLTDREYFLEKAEETWLRWQSAKEISFECSYTRKEELGAFTYQGVMKSSYGNGSAYHMIAIIFEEGIDDYFQKVAPESKVEKTIGKALDKLSKQLF